MFRDSPTAQDWNRHLGSQTRIAVDPTEALTVVRDAWIAAVNSAD